MFRCCNKDCRQQHKGFKLTGQRINIKFVDKDNFQFFRAGKEIEPKIANNINVILDAFGRFKCTCNECGHKAKVKDFVKAYESPMAVFDTDNLCTCGGEIWQDVESVKQDDLPDNVEWEGSQRKVSVKIRSVIRCERCNKEYQPT